MLTLTRRKLLSLAGLFGITGLPHRTLSAQGSLVASLRIYFVGGTVIVPVNGKKIRIAHVHQGVDTPHEAMLVYPKVFAPPLSIAVPKHIDLADFHPHLTGGQSAYSLRCMRGWRFIVDADDTIVFDKTKLLPLREALGSGRLRSNWESDPSRLSAVFDLSGGRLAAGTPVNKEAAAQKWWFEGLSNKHELSDVCVYSWDRKEPIRFTLLRFNGDKFEFSLPPGLALELYVFHVPPVTATSKPPHETLHPAHFGNALLQTAVSPLKRLVTDEFDKEGKAITLPCHPKSSDKRLQYFFPPETEFCVNGYLD